MLAARTWSRPVAAAAALGRRARTDASRQQLSRAMSIAASQQIWYNGELIPWEDANVHVLSTAVMFGMSMFEGIRAAPTRAACCLPSRAACCLPPVPRCLLRWGPGLELCGRQPPPTLPVSDSALPSL